MKTPKEVLFRQHQAAELKLDALRQAVLASLIDAQVSATQPVETPRGSQSLREVLLSFRWHLAGLSAAWLVVLVLNSEPATASGPTFARQKAPPPRQLLIALREHRRQLMELLQPPTPPPPAMPHAFSPRRRSEPTSTLILA